MYMDSNRNEVAAVAEVHVLVILQAGLGIRSMLHEEDLR